MHTSGSGLYPIFKKEIGFLLAFFLFFILPLSAQQPVFKNYGVKDGLPSSEIYHVMQDSKGYMWFCTDAGVSRYDGYTFHNFSSQEGLKDNTVFGSLEDKKGRIWFRTMSGKLFYFQKDSIYGIEANEQITEKLRSGLISSMYIDPSDTVWCGVIVGQGFFRIAPPYKKKDVTFFPLPFFGFVVEVDPFGFIWGTTRPKDYKLNKYNEEPELMKISKQGKWLGKMADVGMPAGSNILKTRSGDFILISQLGVYSLNKKESFYLPGAHFLSLYRILSLFEDKSSNLWVGAAKDGVYYFEKGDLKSPRPGHFLQGLSVSSVTEDSEGGFWFTTLEGGVYYMTSPGFLYYGKENGLSDNKVLAIIGKDKTSILAGMANGDICMLSKDKNAVTLYKEKNSWPGENPIYRFILDSTDGKILAGANCTFLFSPTEKYSREYLIRDKGVNVHKCFTKDKSGHIWAGNHLFITKLGLDKKTVLETYITESRVLSLYADSANTIWAGCINGLWSLQNGTFTYQGNANALFKNRIEDIKVTRSNVWWFATKGNGVVVKNGSDFLMIDKSKGMSSNLCRSIYIEEDSVVWVGTNNGINRITMKKWGHPVVEVFSSDDGLVSNEINEITTTGNLIWAATNQGVVEFNAKAAFSNQAPPPVYISALEINSVPKAIADTFRLKYFENYLKISFTGISYKRSSKMKYQYMLEGIDSKWNYTTNTNLQYTTLPPGAYTFKVYAVNNDGIKSTRPARFFFAISKPFWKEWWFIGLVLVILIGSAIGGVTYRIGLLKKKAAEKSEVNRKIGDLKLMALRAQMNPHFIFNAINSIQLFILKNDSESAHKHLSRFSRLIRNVLENSKHEYISLRVEIETLEHYIELERLRFSSKFNYKIVVGENLGVENILISPLLIQPYVENAIWHGLMHLKDRPGELTIRLEKQGTLLKCSIEDNGIGRKQSAEFKKGKEHNSTGLSLNKERVEIINTMHNSVEGVHFIDKTNSNGLPLGTQVVIYIPININFSEYS